MSKTERVMEMLAENKTIEEIEAETKASKGLISRCKTRYELMKEKKENNEKQEQKEEEEENVTDEDLDKIITKIKVNPPEKYTKPEEKLEDYRCTGCNHTWKSKTVPISCPNCRAEF